MGTGEAQFVAVRYSSLNEAVAFQAYSNGALEFLLDIESDSPRSVPSIAVTLYSQSGTMLVNADTVSLGRCINFQTGHNFVRIRIEKLYLNPDVYVLGLWLAPLASCSGRKAFDYVESAFEIEVVNLESEKLGTKTIGAVTCDFEILEVPNYPQQKMELINEA
jgi:lipopolysaccharide transport system ATP-binding protein